MPETSSSEGIAKMPMVQPTRWAKLWHGCRWILLAALPAILVWLVWRELHALDVHRVRAVLAGADPLLLGAGIGAAFLAVGVMGFYDAVAFPRGSTGKLGFRKRWTLGAVLFGWTNFVAMGPLGGPTLRMIAYRRFGLTGTEITRGFLGHYLGTAAGLVAWLFAAWLPLGASGIGYAGRIAIALGASLMFPVLCARVLIPILRRHRYGAELDNLPLARLGLVSFFDWGLTLLSFRFLTASVGVALDLQGAARTVFTGQFAGLVSMIPGGIGSADAVWFKGFDLLGVGHEAGAAAIVAFRGGFYLAPWIVSMLSMYVFVAKQSERLRLWQHRIIAGAVMLNAILLLLSTATPAIQGRLDVIADVVPLGAIEVSHALAIATAAIMLLLVRGLLRGYRSAYLIVMALLAASAVAHLLKGGDYEESIAAVVLMMLLFGSRKSFTRKGRIPIGWELTLAVGAGALALFLVSGFAAFDRIPYRHDLWLTFEAKAEASRFLRGGVLLAVVLGAAMIRQAMRPVSLFVTPSEDEIGQAETFARAHADSAEPLLVGGGDKGVWFYEDPASAGHPSALFLYQSYGDRLLVFKDPVVPEGVDPAPAIAGFLQFCDELDTEPVFTMISTQWMGYLHDFGFHFVKVTQEAVVPLDDFTLEGHKNAGFRRTIRDMEKAGIEFELIEPPFNEALIAQLRTVSDAWLSAKGGRELQFSACYFSPAYIQRNPVAIARDASGRVIAFVNVLTTRPGGPATIDFMRYIPNIEDGLMDFVLIMTMQKVSGQGASSLSLGGAALGNVGIWRGARLSERMLHLASKKAERIYNYQGLLRYKAKFHPDWVPRYVAFRRPWDWASSLYASARLVEARSRADRRRIAAARMGADA